MASRDDKQPGLSFRFLVGKSEHSSIVNLGGLVVVVACLPGRIQNQFRVSPAVTRSRPLPM